jgi:hypothetical protein
VDEVGNDLGLLLGVDPAREADLAVLHRDREESRVDPERSLQYVSLDLPLDRLIGADERTDEICAREDADQLPVGIEDRAAAAPTLRSGAIVFAGLVIASSAVRASSFSWPSIRWGFS